MGLLSSSHESSSPPAADAAAAHAAQQTVIELDDATIDVLRIFRPPQAITDDENGFPRPVSLRGVSVGSWRLGSQSEAARPDSAALAAPTAVSSAEADGPSEETLESGESGPYLDLLDNDREYRASTYLSVERTLRDRGNHDAAREVLIAGRYRGQRAQVDRNAPFCWRRGDGRLLSQRVVSKWLLPKRRMFLRLKRPPGETSESVAILVGTLAVLALIFILIPLASLSAEWSYKHAAALVVAAILVTDFCVVGLRRGSFSRFGDRLYWSLVDYGTSAWRLLVAIIVLIAASLLLVAPEPENFEPSPITFVAADIAARRGVPKEFHVPCHPATSEEHWGRGEALWMTLRYHVPLVAFGVLEKCVPKDEPLNVSTFGWSDHPLKLEKWFKARDWFGAMAVLNYLLWPLFIPFLIRKFWREERRG